MNCPDIALCWKNHVEWLMRIGLPVELVEKLITNRRGKAAYFILGLAEPRPSDSVLEVGGPSVEFVQAYSRFGEKFIVNRDKSHIVAFTSDNHDLTDISYLIADGCNLPFLDGCVKFCFSYATIEHLPTENRGTFCQEMRRVSSKASFVITPNFWFPFEFHYMLPFAHFLPKYMLKILKKYFRFSHIGRDEDVALLRSTQIKALLGHPSYVFCINRLMGVAATLVGFSNHEKI